MAEANKTTRIRPFMCAAILTAAMVLTLSTASFGAPITLLSVQQFVKTQGSPDTYSQTFKAPAYTSSHHIWVKNGGDGFGKVKNFSIDINGTPVVSSKDFASGDTIVKDVVLNENNTLEVTLKGQAGNALYVEVAGEYVPKIYTK